MPSDGAITLSAAPLGSVIGIAVLANALPDARLTAYDGVPAVPDVWIDVRAKRHGIRSDIADRPKAIRGASEVKQHFATT